MMPTIAERLIDLADELKHPIGELVVADPERECFHNDYLGAALSRTRLAQDFVRKPKGFQLRAIVEEWSHERIVREVY